MTKIKILGDKIIFDGHADTQRECETITLMCDNLAKSVDFKTIKYESGYAEFERIGGTNDLMFALMFNITMNFDSHITKITYDENTVWNNSGEENMIHKGGSTPTTLTFAVTFEDNYTFDAITCSEELSCSYDGNNLIVTTVSSTAGDGIPLTISITSKIPAAKQRIDVSTLSGWESLASGDHSITVKTKASGYLDSASSNAVTVSKAASGYSVTFTDNTNGFLQENGWFYSTDNGETWIDISTLSNLTINGISQIKFKVNNKPSLYSGIDEANYVSITSQSLGVDITAYRNRDPIMSDNYTLSADVSDVVLYAMPD